MTELQMFIEHAAECGQFPIVDWYHKSWLPYKGVLERDAIARDNGSE